MKALAILLVTLQALSPTLNAPLKDSDVVAELELPDDGVHNHEDPDRVGKWTFNYNPGYISVHSATGDRLSIGHNANIKIGDSSLDPALALSGCPADETITSDCTCGGGSCAEGSVCESGLTCTSAASIEDATRALKSTIQSIEDATRALKSTIQSIAEELRKFTTEEKSPSYEEEQVEKLTAAVTSYLRAYCFETNDKKCKPSAMDIVTKQLTSFMDKIKQMEKISSVFLQSFEEKKKTFDESATVVISQAQIETDLDAWAQWTEYGTCTKTCGVGSQTRTRTCTYPRCELYENVVRINAFYGQETQTKDCNIVDCVTCQKGDGQDYTGTVNKTKSGLTCKNWNSDSPHSDHWSSMGDHNYCRNPDGEPGVWCYTTDPNTRFELCAVPVCD